MAQDGLDMNTFYSILNNIFGREEKENYRSGNRSNWAGAMADLRNGWATMQNNRLNKKRKQQYAIGDGDDTNTNNSIGADVNGVYGVGQPAVSITGIGANADGVYGIGQSTPDFSVGVSAIQPKSDNNFSSIFSGQGFNGGSLANPSTPSVSLSNSLAQGIGGQNNVSARDLSRYLGNEYNRANWMAADAQRGVTDPVISMLRYQAKIAPLVQAAKEDRLKNLFMASSNPDLSDEERKQARIQLAGELNKPDLLGELDFANWQRQKAKEEFENGKSMWDLNRLAKEIQIESAKESINDKRASREFQANLENIASAFPDGKLYKINMGSGYADTGLKGTNTELVQALDILNTYVRNRFGKELTVTGGARTPEHNARENGEKNSYHLYGEAVDMVDSGLTQAQRDELVAFAKKIGFNEAKYHDAGSGLHFHVALDKKNHLTGINLGKGKTLTIGQMLGQDNKKTKPTSLITTQEGVGIYGKVGDWISDSFSDGGMKPLIDYMLPIYERYYKSTNSEEQAIQQVKSHLDEAFEARMGKDWKGQANYNQIAKLLGNVQQIYRDEHRQQFDPYQKYYDETDPLNQEIDNSDRPNRARREQAQGGNKSKTGGQKENKDLSLRPSLSDSLAELFPEVKREDIMYD